MCHRETMLLTATDEITLESYTLEAFSGKIRLIQNEHFIAEGHYSILNGVFIGEINLSDGEHWSFEVETDIYNDFQVDVTITVGDRRSVHRFNITHEKKNGGVTNQH